MIAWLRDVAYRLTFDDAKKSTTVFTVNIKKMVNIHFLLNTCLLNSRLMNIS